MTRRETTSPSSLPKMSASERSNGSWKKPTSSYESSPIFVELRQRRRKRMTEEAKAFIRHQMEMDVEAQLDRLEAENAELSERITELVNEAGEREAHHVKEVRKLTDEVNWLHAELQGAEQEVRKMLAAGHHEGMNESRIDGYRAGYKRGYEVREVDV